MHIAVHTRRMAPTPYRLWRWVPVGTVQYMYVQETNDVLQKGGEREERKISHVSYFLLIGPNITQLAIQFGHFRISLLIQLS